MVELVSHTIFKEVHSSTYTHGSNSILLIEGSVEGDAFECYRGRTLL